MTALAPGLRPPGEREGTTAPTRLRSAADHRLRLLLSGVAGLGVIVVATAAALTVTRGLPLTWMLVFLTAATAWADATFINLRIGHHVESYTWAEVILVIGLAVLAPPQLVLTSLSLAVTYAVTGRSPAKVVFNTASHAVGVALAAVVTHAIATPSWTDPQGTLLALIGGAAAFALWNGVTVNAAIAFSQGLPFLAVYSRGAWLRLLVTTGNVVIGLTILWLSAHAPHALVIGPAVTVLLLAGYHSTFRVIEARAIWQNLEVLAQELGRLDTGAVAEVAAVRARGVVEADEVEVAVVSDDGRRMRTVRATHEGTEVVEAHVERVEDRCAVTTVTTALGDRCARRADLRIVLPLDGRDRQLGVLRVHFDRRIRLTPQYRDVLASLSRAVASSLENAMLYRRMCEQAARSEADALRDHLTGLGNRRLLEREAAAALRRGERCGVLIIDLDRFKQINDQHGHACGDAVIRAVADRLRGVVRSSDVVARLGGDEFAVLLDDAVRAAATATRIHEVLQHPIRTEALTLSVGASIGAASAPGDGEDLHGLLASADAAMYAVKERRGRGDRGADDGSGTVTDVLQVEVDGAPESGELVVRYHPHHDRRSGALLGATALVRWRHPQRGLLEPEVFLPAPRTPSLRAGITAAVIDRAAADGAGWQRPDRELFVVVPLGSDDLLDEAVPDRVEHALRRYGLPAHLLVLQVDRATIADAGEHAFLALSHLAATGARVDVGATADPQARRPVGTALAHAGAAATAPSHLWADPPATGAAGAEPTVSAAQMRALTSTGTT